LRFRLLDISLSPVSARRTGSTAASACCRAPRTRRTFVVRVDNLLAAHTAAVTTAAEAFLVEYPQMALERQPIAEPHHTVASSVAVY
jgi:hypothetical protein